ncbi:MAG: nuclear transport factor 2 family protein [Cyclobacteriaceae bacterium]
MMNKILSTLLLSIIMAGVSYGQPQKDEFAMIRQTLNYYLIGGTNNDFETLSKAFHKDATMKFFGEEYKSVNAREFFKKGMKPGPAQQRETAIISIDVSGNAADAKLKITYDTFTFYDYMQLLKIEGEWMIVGKIFYKDSK